MFRQTQPRAAVDAVSQFEELNNQEEIFKAFRK